MVTPIRNALFSRGENPMNPHFTPSGLPVPLQLYGIVWHVIEWYCMVLHGIGWHGMALATWQGGYEWHRSKENVICLVSLATVNPIPLTNSCLIYSLISLPKCLKTHSAISVELHSLGQTIRRHTFWLISLATVNTIPPYYFLLICSISDIHMLKANLIEWWVGLKIFWPFFKYQGDRW